MATKEITPIEQTQRLNENLPPVHHIQVLKPKTSSHSKTIELFKKALKENQQNVKERESKVHGRPPFQIDDLPIFVPSQVVNPNDPLAQWFATARKTVSRWTNWRILGTPYDPIFEPGFGGATLSADVNSGYLDIWSDGPNEGLVGFAVHVKSPFATSASITPSADYAFFAAPAAVLSMESASGWFGVSVEASDGTVVVPARSAEAWTFSTANAAAGLSKFGYVSDLPPHKPGKRLPPQYLLPIVFQMTAGIEYKVSFMMSQQIDYGTDSKPPYFNTHFECHVPFFFMTTL